MKLKLIQTEASEFISKISKPFQLEFSRSIPEFVAFPDTERFLIQAHDLTLVGWHFGFWKNSSAYEMTNSCILPEFRQQGYYENFVNILIMQMKARGAQLLLSRHRVSNIKIVAAKTKLGFEYYGRENDPQFGELLLYRLNLLNPNK